MKLIAVSALLASTVAGFPAAPRDDAYSLLWKPKEGDAVTFAHQADFDIGGTQATLKSKTLEKVLKVDADGTYSVQSSTLDGTVTYLGQQIPMQKPVTVTLYRPNGEVISISGDQVDASSYRAANLGLFRRPDSPVKVGSTWKFDLKADSKSGTKAVSATYKVDGEEKIEDYDTLRITAENRELEGTDAGSISATYWVNKADGAVIKIIAKWSNVTFAGAPSPISGTMTTTRVKS
jgi:hypothetical protein